jgi:hypothetical protein
MGSTPWCLSARGSGRLDVHRAPAPAADSISAQRDRRLAAATSIHNLASPPSDGAALGGSRGADRSVVPGAFRISRGWLDPPLGNPPRSHESRCGARPRKADVMAHRSRAALPRTDPAAHGSARCVRRARLPRCGHRHHGSLGAAARRTAPGSTHPHRRHPLVRSDDLLPPLCRALRTAVRPRRGIPLRTVEVAHRSAQRA